MNSTRTTLRRWPRGKEPPYELLRIRDVLNWLPISRDKVESLEKERKITPFRKRKNAKAWYHKWQLCCEFRRPIKNQNRVPPTEFLRRGDALAWLGVPGSEFESWVRHKIISAQIHGDGGKAYYRLSEIKNKVLRQRGERWKACCSLAEIRGGHV
jgi:hypothetical protein